METKVCYVRLFGLRSDTETSRSELENITVWIQTPDLVAKITDGVGPTSRDEYLVLTPQKCQKQLIETIRCLRAARPALTDRQHVIYSLFLKPNSSLTEAAQSKNAQLDLQNKCEPRTFLQNHK